MNPAFDEAQRNGARNRLDSAGLFPENSLHLVIKLPLMLSNKIPFPVC